MKSDLLITEHKAAGFEKQAAWIFGALSAAAYLVFKRDRPILPGMHDVLWASVSIAAIGVGFLLTANSILIAADGKWIVQRAKEAGAYQILVRYLLNATKWCLASAVLSTVGLLYDPRWNLPWYPYAVAGWMLLGVGALVSLLRVLYVFSEVLLALSES